MAGPTQPSPAAGGGMAQPGGGPAGASRLTGDRLGESAKDYLRHVQLKSVRVSDIVVEPHRVYLNGDRVTELTRSAPAVGNYVTGVAVAYKPGVGYVLVGGEHRLAALSRRRVYETLVYVLSSWRDFIAWMIADKEDGRGLPWTPVDAAHLHNKVVPLFGPARSEKPGWDVAEFTGFYEGMISNVRAAMLVVDDLEQPEPVRREVADFLATIARGGEGASGARDTVKRIQTRYAVATAPPVPAAKQRAMLGEAISTVQGVVEGLQHLGTPSPDLSAEELEQYAAALGSINTKISKIKIALRRS